ncbi:hypothetical protein Tco_0643348 [Tanacetum coccineum]
MEVIQNIVTNQNARPSTLGIAIDLEDSPPKLVKALNKVRQDPNPQPELIDYQLPTGKMTKLTHDEVAELLERDGKIKN